MITTKITVNLNFPTIKAQEELFTIAKRIIIPDIQGRINSGKDISGSKYSPLADSTLRIKQKKGLRSDPLIATGQLRRSPQAEKRGDTAVEIFLSGPRSDTPQSNDDIGDILQNQGVRTKSGKRFFEFFGISDESEDLAIARMHKYIDEVCDGK